MRVTQEWLDARGGLHDARIDAIRSDGGELVLSIDDEWSNSTEDGSSVGNRRPEAPGELHLHNAVVISGDPAAVNCGWISYIVMDADQCLTFTFCDRNPLKVEACSVEWSVRA
jgi:hypothetical protein